MGEKGSDTARDSGERVPSFFVISGVVSESQVCGRVVYLYMMKILEKLKGLCLLRRLYVAPMEEAGGTATWDQVRALSAENEVGVLGIFNSTWEASPEDTAQFRQNEGGLDSFVSAVEEKNAPQSASTSNKIVLKFRVCSWPGDAWDPALGVHPDGFGQDNRFEVQVPRTAITYMSSVSASTSVSILVIALADNSPPTLRVETLSLSNSPTTSLSRERLS